MEIYCPSIDNQSLLISINLNQSQFLYMSISSYIIINVHRHEHMLTSLNMPIPTMS